MRTHTRAYWTPKIGSTAAEYQDALVYEAPDDGYSEAATQRFAVSDGATEAIFSGLWANLLASAWCAGALDLRADTPSQLGALEEIWKDSLPTGTLPWWAEEKITRGSFSTITGLELFEKDNKVRWELQSIGDSCLFIRQHDSIVYCGPLTKSEQFDSSPYLVGSNHLYNKKLAEKVWAGEGECVGPDWEFLLMTDAIACWFLKCVEQGRQPSEILRSLYEDDLDQLTFVSNVNRLRAAGEMRNDDVTLLTVMLLS